MLTAPRTPCLHCDCDLTDVVAAVQDGPDFYLFDAEPAGEAEPVGVVNAPFAFDDGASAAAVSARDWFRTQFPGIAVA